MSYPPGKASRQDLEACFGEYAMGGAGFAVELLADIPDLACEEDGVQRVEALGFYVEGPGRFVPIVVGVA